jgi:hypothetical protein
VPGSVAFIIDIAGAKLRKARSRLPTRCCSLRSGAGVRSTRLPARATQLGPVALWSPKPLLPYCFFTVCGGLAWVATPTGNMGSAVRRCSTFVRIKRGFGYTQRLTLARKMAAIVLTVWKKAVPPAARIEQTVTVGVPIAAVCCERTRLQLRPFLHWCVCPKESMAPGGRLNIGEALGALP